MVMNKAYMRNEWTGCDCEPVDNCPCGPEAEYAALCALVDLFAGHMKAKLREKTAEGYGGWDGDHFESDVQRALLHHVIKAGSDPADYADVANFAAFAWNFRIKGCPCTANNDLCTPCMLAVASVPGGQSVLGLCSMKCELCGGVGVVAKSL